jgi:hypothetical protein
VNWIVFIFACLTAAGIGLQSRNNAIFAFPVLALLLAANFLLPIWLRYRRAKSDRKYSLLRAAVKAELPPFLAVRGFKRNGKSYAARPIDGPMGNTYWRARGKYVDEIRIDWDKYQRPHFGLGFWTDQTERMLEPDRSKLSSFDLDPMYLNFYVTVGPNPARRIRRLHHLFRDDSFWFGQRGTLEKAIALAKLRIAEIDHHLKVGAPTEHMYLVAHVVVKYGDPSNARPIPQPPDAESPPSPPG